MNAEPARSWPRRLDAVRDRAAASFGVTAVSREDCVRTMLTGHRHDAPSYWLQLLVAMGIATLGLVLDSAAVVIGAMLVSPLMGPLVELGMGLAIGSAVLISRALFRTAASVAGVVGGAAILTLLLPFHELTGEIASRTSPTVLDLFVAALCAVMAAYTTLRSTSSSASTAAGAAIAIALVPPLSVVGWGIGTRRWDVTRGAGLLFTANLCAIIFLTVLIFVTFGFDRVKVRAIEEQAAEPARASDRVAARLRELLGSRYGLLLRWLAPLLLVVAVFVPLRHALAEVVWQVRVRRDIQALVERLAPADESVHSAVSVSSHRVTVRLVVLGDATRAKKIEQDLRAGIAKTTEVAPMIDVVAVPDLAVFDKFAAEHETQAPTGPPPPSFPDLNGPRHIVRDYLAGAWPASAAGPLLSWELRLAEAPPASVDVVHFGPALGAAAADLLAHDLTREIGDPVVVVDQVASPEASEAPPEQGASWLPSLLRDARLAERQSSLSICVTVPRVEAHRVLAARLAGAVRAALAGIPDAQRSILVGDHWSSRLSLLPCEPVDAGAPSDAERLTDAASPKRRTTPEPVAAP